MSIKEEHNYPSAVQYTVELLSMSKDTAIVGSYSYFEHKYPSDVDIRSVAIIQAGKDIALNYFHKRFTTIMRSLAAANNTYFIDFKCGYDMDIKNSKPGDSRESRLRSVSYNLNNGNFTKESADKLMVYIDNGHIFNELFRKTYTLRWTPGEIIANSKILPSGKVITFIDALTHGSIIKIDTVAWSGPSTDNRFIGIECLYILTYLDGAKRVELSAFTPYLRAIYTDVMLFSRENTPLYKPLKALKRAWILARLLRSEKSMEELNAVLRSRVAALYQILSDVESLFLILSRYRYNISDVDHRNIIVEIWLIERRLSDHVTPAKLISFGLSEINLKTTFVDILLTLQKLEKYLEGQIHLDSKDYIIQYRNVINDLLERAAPSISRS